ncbi:10425_t:CDS:1, partial [Funneliformis caledonium]
ISDSILRAIRNHLLTEGLTVRQHRNIKNLPKIASQVTTNQKLSTEIYNLIINYANFHGFLLLGHHMQTDSLAVILLPTEKSYISVYEDFVAVSKELDNGTSIISYKNFV